MEKNNITLYPPSGTRDFKPEDLRKREWIFDKWKRTSLLYGFEPYDSSVVEHANLYTRKGGDDILKEMFTLSVGDVDLVLRPEMTPTLARMMMVELPRSPYTPLRWFTERAQCWRYETTSLGRKREHYQWNADIFKADGIEYELELFQMIIHLLKDVGITSNDLIIKVSNRMIFQKILTTLGVEMDLFQKTCNIIDRIKKLSDIDFETSLIEEIGLTLDKVNIIRKLVMITNIDELKEFLPADDDTIIELNTLFDLAKQIGIGEWLTFDVSIVRGLSYYTGTVFEGFFKISFYLKL